MSRIRSVSYALRGLKHVVMNEKNARIHIAAGLFILLAGMYLYFTPARLSVTEVAALVFAVVMVFTAETINTALERTVDLFPKVGRPKRVDMHVEIVKDVMAGAVLLTAFGAIIIGLLVFLPRLAALI